MGLEDGGTTDDSILINLREASGTVCGNLVEHFALRVCGSQGLNCKTANRISRAQRSFDIRGHPPPTLTSQLGNRAQCPPWMRVLFSFSYPQTQVNWVFSSLLLGSEEPTVTWKITDHPRFQLQHWPSNLCTLLQNTTWRFSPSTVQWGDKDREQWSHKIYSLFNSMLPTSYKLKTRKDWREGSACEMLTV